MTKGAIYGNFKDKDEIALAAFDYNFGRIVKKITNVVMAKENACDKIIAMANFYLNFYGDINQNGGCPLLNGAIDSDHFHPPLKKKVREAIDTWLANVARIVGSGIKREQIKANVKPDQFASLFVSLIEGGLMLSMATGNIIHLSRNVDHIIHLVNTDLRR